MPNQLKVLFALLVFCFCFSSIAHFAIFGEDNRKNISPSSKYHELARSTAVALLSGNYTQKSSKTISLDLDHLDDFFCSENRFATDPSLAYACTGFLVAPDIIATAGHCMVNNGQIFNEKENACKAYSWLFDFRNSSSTMKDTQNYPSDRLYHCKEIIYAVNASKAPFNDFALVRLDRPVLDRKPLSLSSKVVSKEDKIFMIGHPFGIPTKLADRAKVLLNNKKRNSFITNLDAFEGNSGSPVFNQAQEVVGILIGGTPMPSSYFDDQLFCENLNHCSEDGSQCDVPDKDSPKLPHFQKIGSEVQKIRSVLDFF